MPTVRREDRPGSSRDGKGVDDQGCLSGKVAQQFGHVKQAARRSDYARNSSGFAWYITERCAKKVKFSRVPIRPGRRRIGPNEVSGEAVPLPGGTAGAAPPGPGTPGCASLRS